MSILTKSYEISVWDDVLEGGQFVEKRLGVIGSDKMVAQCRALEPTLTRNVNGTKKFSFQMYAQYIDNATGEKTKNPFVDWLVSERKVKLKYGSKWFDFIIKDISENSSTHLYTYQLEDALVQELSKNGFGVTLDAELMNNMGTAKELGEFVLDETDWSVESEVFVEKVEEALVYVQFPNNASVTHIFDQQKDDDRNWSAGITTSTSGTNISQTEKNPNRYALAFYSSCTNKPHRFQFIYLSDGYSDQDEETNKYVPKGITDENGVIKAKDCQYYIDIAEPEDETNGYKAVSVTGLPTFYLPNGWSIVATGSIGIGNDGDTTVSNWYRGARYGFAQQAKYILLLDRYCQKFQKAGANYYGYIDTQYDSPAMLQNIVTNIEFKGTSGWVGTYTGTSANQKNIYGAKIESVYGILAGTGFTSVVDYLSNGTYSANATACTPYLKVTFPEAENGNKGILINTGFYDNRTIIASVEENELWYFKPTILSSTNVDASDAFTYELREVSYNSSTDAYILGTLWAEQLIVDGEPTNFMKFTSAVKVTADQFKKKEVKLVIYPKTATSETTYYVKDIQLYKYIETVNKDNNTTRLEPGKVELEGVITTTYKLFPASYVDGASAVSSAEDIVYDTIDKKSMNFGTYVPVYNEGAQKIRSITAKESNYFNILQSIAETFECWVDLVIERNDPSAQGRVTGKKVKFKKYAGKDNYASFRYGVNLKDIQRTYASKNIVTKLMVKANSNEHAKNGFCTIQRAGSNPTGESYIYDFRYFHDRGLLDAKEYVAEMYYETNPLNNNSASSTNVQNYFNRVKALNEEIVDLNDEIIPLQQDLTELKANLAVEEGLLAAANEGIQEIQEDFLQLTGVSIEQIGADAFSETTCTSSDESENFGADELNSSDWAKTADIDVTNKTGGNKFDWTFTISLADSVEASTTERKLYFQPTFKFYVGTGANKKEIETAEKSIKLSCTIPANQTSTTIDYTMAPVDITASNIVNFLTQYATYQAQKNSSTNRINGYTKDGTVYNGLNASITEKEGEIATKQSTLKTKTDIKKDLNKEFFKKYSRFIQEGTWISEEYIDDDKYYADSLSVMYNSCYPQVAYTINVLSLSGLEEYKLFDFEVGDKTFAEDPDFFGTDKREEVIIAEMSENLDDPSKNTIRVQNFKNQFQDLFQKITATVQQTQYSTGSYEKAVALAEASAEVKGEFLSQALSGANSKLSAAGQTTVTQDVNGITLIDSQTQDQMRLIGGAILMSVQDQETGERKWKTGLTPEGISASLITAGSIDTGNISIKNGNDITFLLNEYGITAFDTEWGGNGVSDVDTSKFVRFDKHGIYGMAPYNNITPNGTTWKPSSSQQVQDNSTFALTWEGLKVTNNKGIELRIGDNAKSDSGNTNLLDVRSKDGTDSIFAIKEDGSLVWGAGSASTKALYTRTLIDKPTLEYSKYDDTYTTSKPWHKVKAPEDWYVSYSYDGGRTWDDPIQIQSANTDEIVEWYYATDDSAKTPTREETENIDGQQVSIWKSTPTAAGHSAVKKYLWNYEETKLTNGTSKYSVPVLIAIHPQDGSSIKKLNTYTRKLTHSQWTTGQNGKLTAYTQIGHEEDWWTDEVVGNTVKTYDNSDLKIGDTAYLEGLVTDKKSSDNQEQSIILYGEVMGSGEKNDVAQGRKRSYVTLKTTAVIWGGTQGESGKAIGEVIEYYARSKVSTSVPTDTATTNTEKWDTTLTPPNSEWPYLWNYEVTKYEDNTAAYTSTPVIIAYYTKDGDEGRGITNIQNYYLINSGSTPSKPSTTGNYSSAPASPTSGIWYTTAPKTTVTNEYLWNCEIITYSKAPTTVITEPAVIGTHGKDGESVYILYHDAASPAPTKPDQKDFDLFPSVKGNDPLDEGWYTTQTNDSVYMTQKHCKVSAQADTPWEGVTRISGTLSTYDDLWNVLEEEITGGTQSDGIYAFEDNEKRKRIGINADLIKVGAIRGKQLLNGSEVTNFFLTSSGEGETVEGFFGNANENPWGNSTALNGVAFKAGTNFAVTVDGKIYAKAGKIGGWTIDQDALYSNVGSSTVGMCSVYSEEYYTDNLTFTLSDDSTYYSVTGNDAEATIVVIPGVYDDKPVKYIENNAFYNYARLSFIIIPSSVTNIGSYAFYRCTGLTSVVIPDSVTSIGDYAFSGCDGFMGIEIPDSVTSIGGHAFSGCMGLTSVVIPDSVTSIGEGVFAYSYEITTIYCEATSKPSGWHSGWNKNNRPVVWGHTISHVVDTSYHRPSLVNNGVSYPRFYAGASCVGSIPRTNEPAKFMVLEDGSLYAEAANITGRIIATSGEFEGDVTSTGGNIGGFEIGFASLSSDNESVSITKDGNIKAQNIAITDTFEANKISVNTIYTALGSKGPYVYFGNSALGSETVTFQGSFTVSNEGSDDFWGSIKDKGNATVELTASKVLKSTKTLTVKLKYTKPNNSTAYKIKKESVSMLANKNVATVDVANRVQAETCSYVLSDVICDEIISQPNDSAEAINVTFQGDILPQGADGYYYLGNSNRRWGRLYVNTAFIGKGYLGTSYNESGSVITSDINKKNAIQNIDDKYSALFDQLRPVTFKYNNGTSDRLHAGFIAQEVKESVISSGLTTQEFAGYCEWTDDDGTETCGLRYEEFIALCVDQIQCLKSRVAELESKLSAIDATIED